jgi:hypothetical protein
VSEDDRRLVADVAPGDAVEHRQLAFVFAQVGHVVGGDDGSLESPVLADDGETGIVLAPGPVGGHHLDPRARAVPLPVDEVGYLQTARESRRRRRFAPSARGIGDATLFTAGVNRVRSMRQSTGVG